MQRIAIVECGGSGKTWLARHLGAQFGLPVTHLDALYYDERWRRSPPEQFAARQRALAATPRWVIDGHYASTLPIRLAAADTVVFLDLPATTCPWGIAQRRRRARGEQHPTTGVYDRITQEFVRYVLGYRGRMRPRVEQLIARHAGDARVVVLRSRRAVQRWVRRDPPTRMAVGACVRRSERAVP